MKHDDRAMTPEERRLRMEAIIARYPDLRKDELRLILRWLRKDARIEDASAVSRNEALREPLERLRADHLDRLSPSERAAVWLLAPAAGTAVLLVNLLR